MGGSSGGGDTKTQATPWSGQQPYLTDIFQQAQNQYQSGGPAYYPGQTVTPFSPHTQMALDMNTQRAMQGSPYESAFQNYLTSTMGSGNVDPSQIAASAGQMSQSIPYAQYGLGAIQQATGSYDTAAQRAGMVGQGGQASDPYANALQGMSGYGSLGEAAQFAGSPAMGALPASQNIAQQLASNPNSAINPAAGGQLAATASGQYLGSNPYLDSVFDNAAQGVTERFQEDVMPALAAQFGSSGRTGSGAQALTTGRAAGDVAQELRGLAGDIYAPAYESERNRQTAAAGELGNLGLGTGQLGLGAGQLGGDLFSRMSQDDLGRRGMASDLYLNERSLGQDAMTQAGQQDLARRNLAMGQYSGNLDRGMQASNMLGQLGLGSLGQMNDLYGNIAQNQFRAGSLTPTAQQMDYQNIDRMLQGGNLIEDQAQRLLDSNVNRWNYQQQMPQQQLQNYANLVYGLPGGYGTTTQEGGGSSRLQGALGGGLAGFGAAGVPGAIGGALLGGFL